MNPILYIIVRNDLESMNAGKAMAQVSHSTSLFTHNNSKLKGLKEEWEKTAKYYGTVLVLSANLNQINELNNSNECKNFLCGPMFDDTYPYKVTAEIANLIPTKTDTLERVKLGDSVLLHRRELTCFYIFGEKKDLSKLIGHLPLFL